MLPTFSHFAGRRVHLGVCGSVAAYKAIELARLFQKADMFVSSTITEAACQFISPLTFEGIGASPVYTKMFDDTQNSCFSHLDPGFVADVFVLAPASATTLARLATGMADTMLAAQSLAFHGPLVLAPAMNPRMWGHPATQANVALLQQRGATVVGPAGGNVACGEEGVGKLEDINTIFLHTLKALSPQNLAGKSVLVTLGPTREQWDGVRFWSNPSTGHMGGVLALAAWLRGASVVAVAGPGTKPLPKGIHTVPVTSAKEMFAAAEAHWHKADIGIFTAAVADFSPVPFGPAKFKKTTASQDLTVQFTPNKDILATLSLAKSNNQKVLGFAAETDNMQERTRGKLLAKKAHLMAGNTIGVPGSGFGSTTNTMFVVDANGKEEHWENMSKADIAWRLLDWLLTL